MLLIQMFNNTGDSGVFQNKVKMATPLTVLIVNKKDKIVSIVTFLKW